MTKKIVKLVHLVGFITKKFVTMHGHMNVKFILCILLQLIHQPTTALSKIQFSTNINLLTLSAPGAILRKSFRLEAYNPNTLI